MQISEGDLVALEQHIDLLKNRSFRQSLFCHADMPLKRQIDPDQIAGLYFAGQFKLDSDRQTLHTAEAVKFVTPSGVSFSSSSPLVNAALVHLNDQWPRAVSLDALSEASAAALDSKAEPTNLSVEKQNLRLHLIQCLASGLLQAFSDPGDCVSIPTERPLSSRLARLQAGLGMSVTNRRHEPVMLDEVSRNLLLHLDGEHDRPALLQMLISAVDRGELSILKNEIPASSGEAVREILEQTLEQSLASLASQALFVA